MDVKQETMAGITQPEPPAAEAAPEDAVAAPEPQEAAPEIQDAAPSLADLGCTRLSITGHSLGAAVAAIASFELRAAFGFHVDAGGSVALFWL